MSTINRADPLWPGDAKIQKLADRAGGLVVWVDTAIRFISGGTDEAGRLDCVLSDDLRNRSGGDFNALDALYSLVLHQNFQSMVQSERATLNATLGAIMVARAPLPVETLMSLLGTTGIQAAVVGKTLHNLASILRGGKRALRLHHPSLEDFLINRNRAGDFFVDRPKSDALLARASLGVLTSELKFNICGLETSHCLNDDIHGLATCVDQVISGALRYSCMFWADHLNQTNRVETDLLDQVQSTFFTASQPRILYWFEALSLLKQVVVAAPSLQSAMDWMGVSDSPSFASYADAHMI